MEKASVVAIGFLCVMLVVIQSGKTPYGLKKTKPEFIRVNGGEFSADIDNFIQKYRNQLSRRLLRKNKAEYGDGFFDNGNSIEEYRQRYASDRGSTGASGDYYDYGLCNGVRHDGPFSSCDQCVDACAKIFTKPLCTYDSVSKGAYVCTCCI
ncbi:hypothetical protein C5167_021443 [Papaver somniferum]|nr:hypothetical protein C5167_021443 [Papaver somniferum]